ncbi:MAG: hypothetical protein DMF78_08830 [Acidobacteria bacterium]|nr:MAG: hypothetical protein DMF78_08830 [Acidobacteriota bacterium]
MICRAAASVLLSAALGCASSGAPAALATTLPAGLPSTAILADWERIEGAYDTPTEHVRYVLFVDPERPALYRITQYRVMARAGSAARTGGGETLIWNERPGRRGPLRCFTEDRSPSWRTLWLVPRSSWRDVAPATVEFRGSMLRAIEIYGRVNDAHRSGPPVSGDAPRS